MAVFNNDLFLEMRKVW